MVVYGQRWIPRIDAGYVDPKNSPIANQGFQKVHFFIIILRLSNTGNAAPGIYFDENITNFYKETRIGRKDLGDFGKILEEEMAVEEGLENLFICLERHGQNVRVCEGLSSEKFRNLGQEWYRRYNWQKMESFSIAWTQELCPAVETGMENSNSLFVSAKGAKKVMERPVAYRKGSLSSICNYQSESGFIPLQNWAQDHAEITLGKVNSANTNFSRKFTATRRGFFDQISGKNRFIMVAILIYFQDSNLKMETSTHFRYVTL